MAHFSTTTEEIVEEEKEDLGGKDILELLNMKNYRRVRQVIEADTRERIGKEEYYKTCANLEISQDDADKLLRGLHGAGIALNYRGSNIIHIKPEVLSESVLKLVDPDGSYLLSRLKAKRLEYRGLMEERAPLHEIREKIESKARKSANRRLGAVMGGMVVFAGILARLIWWELSWDIMEPITYYITMMTGVYGLFYYALRRREYTYDNMYTSWMDKAREKLKKKIAFDKDRYDLLTERIDVVIAQTQSVESEILAKGLSKNPGQLFMDEIEESKEE